MLISGAIQCNSSLIFRIYGQPLYTLPEISSASLWKQANDLPIEKAWLAEDANADQRRLRHQDWTLKQNQAAVHWLATCGESVGEHPSYWKFRA